MSGSPPDSDPPAEPSELPPGVEPWSGDEMPEGVVSELPPPGPTFAPPSASEIDASLKSGATPTTPATPRQYYETELRGLPNDARVARAKRADKLTLQALCYDPAPQVVACVVDHPEFGLDEARAIAKNHANPSGLEILARRVQLLRDAQVAQRLLRNPQCPSGVLSRILSPKPLRQVYQSAIDRDLPDRSRSQVRSLLRTRWNSASPDHRADLVLRTDGRVLMLLTGLTFDGRMTAILCAKTFNSTLLIQSLARFSATPPPLLSKLMQQPMVRRQPQLRALLLRHPNLPGDLKRRG